MRLADIAKELRITTQELRKELTKTNFGIDSAAHEVDDNLGKGIVRFLKGKVKPTLTHRRVESEFQEDLSGVASSSEKEKKEEGKKEKRIFIVGKEGQVEEKITEKAEEVSMQEEQDSKETDEESESSVADSSVNDEVDLPKAKGAAEPKKEKREETVNDRIAAAIAKNEIKVLPKKGFAQLRVSHRIEVDTKPAESDTSHLPKKYYKTKGKKGKKRHSEEEILSVMRHPHAANKPHVARVHYQADENVRAEEIEFERELDRERFRDQKKHRATSQKRGHKAQPQIKPKTGVIEIPAVISLKEFSEKCGLPVMDVIANLLKNGIMATINQQLDFETAMLVAADLGVEVKMTEKEVSSEDLLAGDMHALMAEEDKSLLVTRPPIVTIMGHVDHGKTKLLDTIRSSNVVAAEAGGITQHIGAYQVEKNGKLITFLDTPGHEAFTSMRARGAKVTDIAILVVAADEGVKPQTIEALNHAKEAGVPIIVAINKIDKPNANLDKVKGQLVEHGLQPEDWGGSTVVAPVSAHTGQGIDDLLEMILLVAEVEQLKANPNRLAVGTVVESHLDPSLGPVATILVNTGTLHATDSVVVGTTLGKIKVMHDHNGNVLKECPPSGAARISGLSEVPKAGDILQAFKNERVAKQRLAQLIDMKRLDDESQSGSMVERIVSQINKGDMKYLKLVIKADTKGSLEAITQALNKIKGHEIAVKVIHYGVGNISDTDVIMASASQALLVGFHVEANAHVVKLAEKEHVDIKEYTIIYKLIEDVKAIMSGMLEPEINVIELGKLEIKQIFLNKKIWVIAGCKVTEGRVQKEALVRVKRHDELLFEAKLESLKHVKEEVAELEKGSECGIKIKTPKPVEVGDILEAFKIEKVQRTLDN
ncbi:translation initiation factor IF-2 [Candidatus Peregrinibacteria bacterium]|nr:MAG: translation initiation factor IF-2 [Candidatus Peregrinibacteria bacterium]